MDVMNLIVLIILIMLKIFKKHSDTSADIPSDTSADALARIA